MKFTALFIFLFCLGHLQAQQLPAGIYAINSNTDTGFIHRFVKPFTPVHSPWGTKVDYVYHYHNLLAKEFNITHAVVVAADMFGEKVEGTNRIIFLNNYEPQQLAYTYTDDIPRKFMAMDISLDRVNKQWQQRCYSNGFLCFANFNNENDVASPIGWNGHYAGAKYIWQNNTLLLLGTFYKLTDTEQKTADGTPVLLQDRPVTMLELKARKPYKSVMSLPYDTKFYYSENRTDKEKILTAGNIIAVTNESPEYMYGDMVQVNGTTTTGKIFIDDLTKGDTTTQTVNRIKLNIKYTPAIAENNYYERGNIIRIKTYYRGKLLQVLKEGGLLQDTGHFITTPDINFDGQPDLAVYASDGSASLNFSIHYYVFNRANKHFEYNKILSELLQPEIDDKKKTISSLWRAGAGTYGFATYRWRNGKIEIEEQTDIVYLDDNEIEATITKYKNGKEVYKKTSKNNANIFWENKRR